MNRARQDYHMWQGLINNGVVEHPPLTKRQLFFWQEMARLYNRPKAVFRLSKTEKKLKKYPNDKGSVLAFSGGLESSVIHHTMPNVPTFDILNSMFKWTNPIEPALMIYGSGLGYTTIFYGAELLEGKNYKFKNGDKDNQFHNYLATLWLEYAGVHFIPPLIQFTKQDIFKAAIRDGVTFSSCFANVKGKWCGTCYKCHLIDLLYKLEGKKSPIKLKNTITDVFAGKINQAEIDVYNNLLKKCTCKK